MGVRILRLLEYHFEDNESAEASMNRWAVPTNGSIIFGRNVIRSAIISDLMDATLEEAKRYREIAQAVADDSLARAGWEMIQSAMRDADADDD